MARERSERLWSRLGGLGYGADYSPEQSDEATWQRDAALMREAGVNLVTVGPFAWAALEPQPGQWELAWLDRVMDLLADAGIAAWLATGTASPPPWLATRHPETLPVDVDGRTLWHGARQHFCPSSPVFREHAGRLVQRLAQRYGGHPALAAWHVGNEYGEHVARCYCDVSAADFRAWLRRRYGDLDALNVAWSTTFWSQRYGRWEEIVPPRATPTFPNPAQQLDFIRFSSDALLACFEHEAQILDRLTPEVPISTNFIHPDRVDPFAWAAREDFISFDSYPDPSDPDAALGAAMGFDLMRGAGRGARWLLAEQAPSAVNWRERNAPKRPGIYRLWSWQAIAHGAGGVMAFQWRASRGGAEKFHSAFVPHAGEESAAFARVRALGDELAGATTLADTAPAPAPVAIVLDWSSLHALELPARPSSHLRLMDLLRAWYEPLWRATVPVDLVPPSADLDDYRVVLVPNLYLMRDEWGEALARFVERGGRLVVGFFSGIVDEHDIVPPGAYPATLRDLLGIETVEFWPLEVGERVGLRLRAGGEGTGELWSEDLVARDAEVLASFATGPLTGRPALTRARRGAGSAWYLATLPNPETLRAVLAEVLTEAGVRGLLPSPAPGIEAAERVTDDGRLLFLLNHGTDRVEIALESEEGWNSLVGPAPQAARVGLEGLGVAVLHRSG